MLYVQLGKGVDVTVSTNITGVVDTPMYDV
jgi:hypothetical protein